MDYAKIFSCPLSLTVALCGFLLSCSGPVQPVQYTDFVNPFIGTGGHGHVFLGANVPFGFVQLGPSQRVQGWDWCSGYHYSDSVLVGFSHTHLSGTGVGDLGDILFFPTVDVNEKSSVFSHSDETASPGYYSITLDGVNVELTATSHAGLHRYSFNPSDTAYVKIDMQYGIGWDRPVETGLTLENDSTISGFRFSSGWARDQKIYFYAEFSRPMSGCDISDTLAICKFNPSTESLYIRVGLSANGVEQARSNLFTEVGEKDFGTVRAEALGKWNDMLSRIQISTTDEKTRRIFYTALYHSFFAPVEFSDASCSSPEYTVLSLWDTYRSAHPLYTLVIPEMQGDFARTFLKIYDRQGKLPVWHLHGNETDCMIGNPGVIVLGDLFSKGFVEDSLAAFQAMVNSAMLDERSLGALRYYGYIPYDAPGCSESVAKGLEYAIADDAIAKVARSIGQASEAFEKRATAYRHYFDSTVNFMRAKDVNGNFRPDFDAFVADHRANDYCEGNAWQYVWLVPHDPHGLIELFGSEEAFVSKLDSLFILQGDLGENASPDISGLLGQYAHGNEPGHHTVYLYNYAGQPSKAAPLLRHILRELYDDTPEGLCGNEDVGQMSAWYILSAMGIYQVEPVGGKFVIGSPLFDKSAISLPGGKSFTVEARNNSSENIFVKSASLNGKPLSRSYITFDEICAGGTLTLEMASEPSEFGTAPADRP